MKKEAEEEASSGPTPEGCRWSGGRPVVTVPTLWVTITKDCTERGKRRQRTMTTMKTKKTVRLAGPPSHAEPALGWSGWPHLNLRFLRWMRTEAGMCQLLNGRNKKGQDNISLELMGKFLGGNQCSRLACFLDLQFTLGLLEDGLDGFVGATFGCADTGGNVAQKKEAKQRKR